MGDAQLQYLEEELKKAKELYDRLKDSKKEEQRLLAEYQLGLFSGLTKAIESLGYGDWLEDVLSRLGAEDYDPEVKMTVNALDRWLRRRVLFSNKRIGAWGSY